MTKAGSIHSLAFEQATFEELRDMITSIFPDCLVTAEKEDIVFRAELANETMGFIHIGTREGGWRIIGIGVKEGLRGREYGRQILDFAIRMIRAMGGHIITLLVDGKNKAAISMYAHAGFRPVGREKGRIKMMLTLNT
jgi:ribosomal protein S18 acetylase RimI-like enzyme